MLGSQNADEVRGSALLHLTAIGAKVESLPLDAVRRAQPRGADTSMEVIVLCDQMTIAFHGVEYATNSVD